MTVVIFVTVLFFCINSAGKKNYKKHISRVRLMMAITFHTFFVCIYTLKTITYNNNIFTQTIIPLFSVLQKNIRSA